MHGLRVATLNRPGAWPARREMLRTGFQALKPDVIALQETVVCDDQVRELFGTEYHVVHQGRRNAEGVGCSIVSRWPPQAVEDVARCVTDRVNPADFPGHGSTT